MKIKYYTIVLIALFFSFNSFSQTQLEMNKAADAKYKKADVELNKVYKKLISILNQSEKLLLIQAEKDWVKFRDSSCKFESSQYEGGSIKPLIYSTCLEELTRKRILEIKANIKERNKK
ncbi:lysozyme inhibitor LprI family protein [Flavobacterium sp. GSP14]|uniref:lysozyme inhibitor LprI family protein n=1 Tax=Flavobacterium sp. GSP14 TaxID=3401734 RepID=UPI003AAB113B